MAGLLPDGEHTEEAFTDRRAGDEPVRGASFVDCTFTGCDLEGLELVGGELDGCTFTDCNLSLLRPVDTRISETRFTRCKLTGVDWTLAAWPHLAVSDLVAFERCRLDHSTFAGLRLPEVRFHRCSLREVDLSECDLTGASFVHSELDGAHLARTDLSGAHLEGATGYRIDVRSNQLRGATVSLPEAASFLAQLGLEVVEPPPPDDREG